ncbi:prepilin-type N-terminal cleavage/methylation domain-containing protein [Candidatus Uabimicrobium sp. HlEnr_7]|uniref:prepilin-type N-terminal cleavage/methylation domain-containing protein n=1 Tax=Candidatus Uabimicrobium helgolandensis TaxID=3095367 RepID=UPI0035585FDB
MKRKRSKSTGFTLIEVLIATTILSIILTMAYSILITTLNSRNFIEARVQTERVGNRLLNFISKDIQGAYMYQVQDDRYFFARKQGKNTRIDFISNTDSILLAPGGNHSDLCEIGYFLKKNRDGTHRIIRREDFFIDKDPFSGGLGIKLYDEVVSFELRFYENGKAESTWNSTQKKQLPQAVEIILGIKQEKEVRLFRRTVPILVSRKIPAPEKKKPQKENKK